MLLTTAILTVCLASLVQASPVSLERRELGGVRVPVNESRPQPGLTFKQVLICNGPNGQGHCEYDVYQLETCYNLPPALVNNAATFAPDDAAFFCYPYMYVCLA